MYIALQRIGVGSCRAETANTSAAHCAIMLHGNKLGPMPMIAFTLRAVPRRKAYAAGLRALPLVSI